MDHSPTNIVQMKMKKEERSWRKKEIKNAGWHGIPQTDTVSSIPGYCGQICAFIPNLKKVMFTFSYKDHQVTNTQINLW